jgi:hypothetical protein
VLAGTDRGIDVDARPQPQTAHGEHAVADQPVQARM